MEKREKYAAIIRIIFYFIVVAFASYMMMSQMVSGVYLYPTWVLVVILVLIVAAICGELYALIKKDKKNKGD